jgi:hypothetical protein
MMMENVLVLAQESFQILQGKSGSIERRGLTRVFDELFHVFLSIPLDSLSGDYDTQF